MNAHIYIYTLYIYIYIYVYVKHFSFDFCLLFFQPGQQIASRRMVLRRAPRARRAGPLGGHKLGQVRLRQVVCCFRLYKEVNASIIDSSKISKTSKIIVTTLKGLVVLECIKQFNAAYTYRMCISRFMLRINNAYHSPA